MKLKKIAVFASGKGSNFSTILKEIKKGNIPAEISCVISDRARPGVFEIAKKANIPTHFINVKQFKDGDDFTEFLISLLDNYKVDLILLAGYLKLIPIPVVKKYNNAIINIHPALIPNFCGKGYYGIKVHQAVIESGVKITGVTVHFVDEHYDTGRIIVQEKVPVLSDDTPETLAKRVLKMEHIIFPKVVKGICEGKIKIQGGKVIWEK